MKKLDLRGAVIPAIVFVGLELLAWAVQLDSDSIAAPSRILIAWAQALLSGEMVVATLETLACAFTGLAIGALLGTLIGIVLGLLPVVDKLGEVSLEWMRPIPSVALIPIALLIFGFGFRSEIAITTFTSFWPVMIITRAAVRSVEPSLFEVAKSLRMTQMDLVRKIIIPAVLPRSFVALRLAVGVSLIVAVTVEITANPIGMGSQMMSASQGLRPDLMFAYLFWIGLVGWSLNKLMDVLQYRLLSPLGLVGGQP